MSHYSLYPNERNLNKSVFFLFSHAQLSVSQMEVGGMGKLENMGTQQAEKEKERESNIEYIFFFTRRSRLEIIRSIELFWTLNWLFNKLQSAPVPFNDWMHLSINTWAFNLIDIMRFILYGLATRAQSVAFDSIF